MKTTFGEWLRWTIARKGIQRPELARDIGCSLATVGNMMRRPKPGRMNDVILARLASKLNMTEPELLTAYQKGLPDDWIPPAPPPRSAPTAAKSKPTKRKKDM